MADTLERIETALGAMTIAGPRALRAYLELPGPDWERANEAEVDRAVDLLLSTDPNSPARLRFSGLLRSWDNAHGAKWEAGTSRNSAARRELIHKLMKSGPELARRIDTLLPFYHLDEPLVIADRHEEWYSPQPGLRDYYWKTYVQYLGEKRGWSEASLLSLDNSTRAIVECLANPESPKAYASRGLVMGYVQSGKTANFMGVAARAADAGYRLIIVLAGTWNILRNQTQRRFDKELLGKELLRNDETYTLQNPPDWSEFLEHGTDPVQGGNYTWQRLTRPDYDFRRLKAAIDNLEFERTNKSAPVYDPSNLHELPAKLLVIKKHSGILHNLVKDFRLLRTQLKDVPTLIIDDESDQAGLNVVAPEARASGESRERSKTNLRIVELLELFPRGQYIGYTATPYANALVDPDDPEDLFPKDFIISLERPQGYMGVADFFDASTAYEDLSKGDWAQPEIAYVRRVKSPPGDDDEDLRKALRSYVLSGALKLYRQALDSSRYSPAPFKHHTMLVHTSQRTGAHTTVAIRLKRLWDECAFNSPKGLGRLNELWESDYRQVSEANGTELVPRSVEALVPYLSEAIKRIESGPDIFLVVNSDSPAAPDFSAAPVWKILVGGNKLSRGYTIEGLTVSYYRRVSRTGDTLMQMGRWFGFRPGYQDLVRVFLGVAEGKGGDTDLVSLFKEVCRMEERFRQEIKRYVRRPGAKPITPKEIPPLIAVSGELPPTAKNKMFNAVLATKNFGGQRSMLTLLPTSPEAMRANVATLSRLLSAAHPLGERSLGGTGSDSQRVATSAIVFEATNEQLVTFLQEYRWLESDYASGERPADTNLQIEFLADQKHGINGWLLMAPQRSQSFGQPLAFEGGRSLSVKERHRVAGGRRFGVFGEPDHRTIAEFLAGVEPGSAELAEPNAATRLLRDNRRGVCLIYPAREQSTGAVSIGFELIFPENDLPFEMNFTVRRKAENDMIVVPDNG